MPAFSRLIYLALLVLLVGCEESPQSSGTQQVDPVYLVAVNSPLQTFARRLSGGRVEVRMPASGLPDPAQWQPGVDEIRLLQGAQLVLLNGAGYSPWINQVTLSDRRLVVTGSAGESRWIELTGEVTHSHGPGGEHAHGGYALTTWMDMEFAAVQAGAVAVALQKLWPGDTAEIELQLERLLADIDTLDRAYQALASKLAGTQIIYSHPVYQYFERRYGLPGFSLHWEPDVMPSAEQWQALQAQLQAETLFFWEAEPDSAISARLSTLGLKQVTLDPGANTGEGDWINLQSANIERLQVLVDSR